MLVDLQILDNEASTEYKCITKSDWGVGYQLVTPHIHHRNAAERTIHTFKAHFISTLAGIAPTLPKNLWDLLLPQIELTFNLLRQSTLKPNISAWEYFQGPFEYKATPLGHLCCPVMIHRKTSNCKSWEFRVKEGWRIGVALNHYLCQRVIPQDTKAKKISNTVELLHQTITTPLITPKDRIFNGLTKLTDVFTDAPMAHSDAQRQAISDLCNASNSWAAPNVRPDPAVPIPRPTPAQNTHAIKILERKIKHPVITHKPNPRMPKKTARCEPSTMRTIHKHVPAQFPRLNPKETPLISSAHSNLHQAPQKNAQPPIALSTRYQLQHSIRVTP